VFRGRYRHTIDAKGRVSIPSRYRDLIKAAHGDALVIVPVRGRPIDVYPLAEWERMEQRVNGRSNFDPDVRRLRERYLSWGEEVVLDPQGRIQVRQECRDRAGLGRDVVIMGMGPFFSIWDAAQLAAHDEGAETEPLEDLFARIRDLGI